MNQIEQIKTQINNSIKTKLAVLELLPAVIATAGEVLVESLKQGHKILVCGNGGSAADAQHFAAELLIRYMRERRPLPAIALTVDPSTITAAANDYSYDQVFNRQIQALGQPGDVLIAITTSGNSKSILNAVETARAQGMKIIALTGQGGGRLTGMLQPTDTHICIPSEVVSHIQESHMMILHCLCDVIDNGIA